MATLLDTSFPGADEAPIGAPFATAAGIASGMRKVGNQAAAAGASVFSVSYDASNTYPQDHEATIYFGVVGGRDCGPTVRTTDTGCYFMNSADGSNIRVYKRGGTFYELGVVVGVAYSAASRYTLRATGGTPTTLKVYQDGVQVGSDIVDDGETYGPCLTSGAAGMAGYDGTFRFSRFVGADLGAGGSGGAVSGNATLDEPAADGGAASAADLGGNASLDEPTAGGGAASAADLSGNATIDEPTAAGGLAGTASAISGDALVDEPAAGGGVASAADVSGNAQADEPAAAGGLASAAGLTSSDLEENNGTVHSNAPFEARVYSTVDGSLVVRKTGLTSTTSATAPRCSFQDVALVAGTTYYVHWIRTDTGQYGMERLVAA
jgi:hypothetical protein